MISCDWFGLSPVTSRRPFELSLGYSGPRCPTVRFFEPVLLDTARRLLTCHLSMTCKQRFDCQCSSTFRSSAAVRSCDHPALLDLSASQHRSRAASEAVCPFGRPTSLEPFNLSIARFSRSAAFESDRSFNRSAPPALDLCNLAILRPLSSIDE